jgi:hypothetical protein
MKARLRILLAGMVLGSLMMATMGNSTQAQFPIVASQEKDIRYRQDVETRIELSKDGSLKGEMTLENTSNLWGLCSVVYFAIKDAHGNVLEVHRIPEACVELSERPITKTVRWNDYVKRDETLKKAARIEIKVFESSEDPRDLFGAESEDLKAIFERSL